MKNIDEIISKEIIENLEKLTVALKDLDVILANLKNNGLDIKIEITSKLL